MTIILDPSTTPPPTFAIGMTLGEAQGALASRGFDYLTANRQTFMLNAAKDEFEDLWEWPWLSTLTGGLTPLLLPDLKLVVTVQSGRRELMGLDLRQVAQDGTDMTLKGAPAYWWINGASELHAWPGDGASVNVVYIKDTPPLVNPSDVCLIPARYQPLWLDLAVCEAYKDSDNYAASQALRADVIARLQDVIGRYETRNRQHSPFISVRGPYSEDE